MVFRLCNGGAVLVVVALACGTTYRKSRTDLPEPERSVAELSALVEDFEAALEAHQFDVAQAMLEELREGTKEVDEAVVILPGYAAVASIVVEAPRRIAQARRDHAVDQLRAEAIGLLDAGEAVLEKMRDEGPTREGLQALEETMATLRALPQKAQQYRAHAGWVEMAERLDEQLFAFADAAADLRWRLELTETIDEAVIGAEEKNRAASEKGDLDDQIEAVEALAEAMQRCIEIVRASMAKRGYGFDAELRSRIGILTVEQTGEACTQRRAEALRRRQTLRWKRRVQAVATRVDEALQELAAQREPELMLRANESAAAVLVSCAKDLEGTETQPGYSSEVTFRTALGALDAVALRSACGAQHGRLAQQRPTLRWRIAAAALRERIEAANEKISGLADASDGHQKAKLVAEVLPVLRECLERTAALAQRKIDPWRAAEPSKKEVAAIKSLWRDCSKTQKRLSKTRKPSRKKEKKKRR